GWRDDRAADGRRNRRRNRVRRLRRVQAERSGLRRVASDGSGKPDIRPGPGPGRSGGLGARPPRRRSGHCGLQRGWLTWRVLVTFGEIGKEWGALLLSA